MKKQKLYKKICGSMLLGLLVMATASTTAFTENMCEMETELEEIEISTMEELSIIQEEECDETEIEIVSEVEVEIAAETEIVEEILEPENYEELYELEEVTEDFDNIESVTEDAANASFNEAVNISVNQIYRGNLVTSSDEKYYKFSVLSAGYVSLDFSHEYVDSGSSFWEVRIFDSNKKELIYKSYVGNTTETVTTTKVGVPSGIYYIKINKDYFYHSDVKYSLKVNYTASSAWETEFNDTFDTSDVISTGNTVNGSLMSGGDVDYYRFDITSAGYISLDFSHEYVDSGNTYWEVRLYDSNRKELMYKSYVGNTTATVTTTKVGVPSGIYYIKINKDYFHHSDVKYSLKVNYTASSAWETEFNDTFDMSDVIFAGNTVNGSLMCDGDVDYYRFDITGVGYISLDFSHEYVNNGNTYWEICLYNSNRKELMYRSYVGNTTATITTTEVGVPSGTYYIKINKDYFHHSDVKYSLKVNYTASSAWETEFNDTFDSSDTISMGNVASGSLMGDGDVDYYGFDITSAGYIWLDFSHEYVDSGNTYWEVRLYDSNRKELICRSYVGNTTATIASAKVGVPPGTYFIKINKDYFHHSDVKYSLKVNYTASTSWETEFNDSFDTADVISVGNAVNGSLMESDDVDYYTLQIPKLSKYQVTFEHEFIDSNNSYWKVDLFNSNKEKIYSYFYRGKSISETENPIYLQSGTYYAKVYRDYHSTFRYSLKLSEYSHKHSYKTYVTKATTWSNGSIVRKCSCGLVESRKTIYYAQLISLSSTGYHYDRTIKTPKVTVKGSDGKVISSSNYTVKYASGRKNVGRYDVKITFKGNYTGTVYRTFYIWPKYTSISKLSGEYRGLYVKWNKQTEQVSGYQIQYSRRKDFVGATTKTITNKTTASANISYLQSKTQYYVRVRTYKDISGRRYCSRWSSAKSVKTK